MKKKQLTASELLATIKVNLHHFLASFPKHVRGKSYTKTGPGRKAKMIKRDRHGNPLQKWIPRQIEQPMIF